MFNYSIIIPTYNHLEDCLKPCINSILKYTDFSNLDIQLIIVSNGSTDGTDDYLDELYQNYKSFLSVIKIDNPIGFPKAINEGLKYAFGKYVILLNNDTELISQFKNKWINTLYRPFVKNSNLGITGCHSLTCPITNEEFILFFCCMIKKEVFDQIGNLNESFSPGYGEDIDFCIRAKNAGFDILNVNSNIHIPKGQNYVIGDFPLNHKGEVTVHELSNWEEIKQKNNELLKKFHGIKNKKGISLKKLMEEKKIVKENTIITQLNSKEVTVGISTKDRYYTTLPLTIQSIINQTVPPRKILIFDDSEDQLNLEQVGLFNNLFSVLKSKYIDYEVITGEKKGQIFNHQNCLELAKTEYIWRLDDDNSPEPNVLESLLNEIEKDEKIGAIGSLILDSQLPNNTIPSFASSKIEDIFFGINIQWFIHKDLKVKEVDHLYSSFLYRKKAGFPIGYCLDLSKIGFREETIFTYEMKRNNWKLLVNPNIITWHFRESEGGVRNLDNNLRQKDEALFYQKLTNEWKITPRYLKTFLLYNGIGDHFMFKMILPKIVKKYSNNYKLVIGCCHPKVFSDIEEIELTSIDDLINVYGNSYLEKSCIYTWCKKNNWNDSLLNAMKQFYLGE